MTTTKTFIVPNALLADKFRNIVNHVEDCRHATVLEVGKAFQDNLDDKRYAVVVESTVQRELVFLEGVRYMTWRFYSAMEEAIKDHVYKL